MAQQTNAGPIVGPPVAAPAVSHAPAYQAYQVLHWSFVVLPIVAGLDKFFHLLVNWDQYLSPAIPQMLHLNGHVIMMAVGVIEIVAGIIVAAKPRIGAWIVTAWLWLIVINLMVMRSFFDIAARDFFLSMGALALARISDEYNRS